VSKVKIVEVGPRDGLQNEAQQLSVEQKIELIQKLGQTGLSTIEAGAFVSPQRVPQMADTAQVLAQLDLNGPIEYPVLVPNMRGLDDALAAGARQIAIFGAASETFSQKNIHCSIGESMERFEPVVQRALDQGLSVRGYLSCVAGCPYEGPIAPQKVGEVAGELFDLGCSEISLGDTIGIGNPNSILSMLEAVVWRVPMEKLAGHFHDTYGMAVANVYAAFHAGIMTFDSSIAGLGGCPYAPGASGNVATEDLVWLFQGLGVETGVDLPGLVDTAHWVAQLLGRTPASRVAHALAR
jgi:hydroxymethylglutaryl-CoA lyase